MPSAAAVQRKAQKVRQKLGDMLTSWGMPIEVVRDAHYDKEGNYVPQQTNVYYGLYSQLHRSTVPQVSIEEGGIPVSGADPHSIEFPWDSDVRENDTCHFNEAIWKITRRDPSRIGPHIVSWVVGVNRIALDEGSE